MSVSLNELVGGKIVEISKIDLSKGEEGCNSMVGCEGLMIIVRKEDSLYILKAVSWDYEDYRSGLDIKITKVRCE